MKIEFFAGRAAARTAAKELNGKFKDMGANSPAGERWSVQFEEVVSTESVLPPIEADKFSDAHNQLVQTLKAIDALEVESPLKRITFLSEFANPVVVKDTTVKVKTIQKNVPAGIIGEQLLKSPNNKPVRVLWRRNMLAVRLAATMASAL